MKNKKAIIIILALLILFNVCGCSLETSSKKTSLNTKNTTNTQEQTQTTTKAQLRDDVDYSTYQSYWLKQFDYTVMPILGYNACPNKGERYTQNFANYDSLKLLKDCGFNGAYALYEILPGAKEDVINILEACDELQISYIARVSGDFNQSNKLTIKSALSDIMDYDSFGGVLVSDEPGYRMFNQLKKTLDSYKTVIPDCYLYTNLFPDYATPKQLYRSQANQTELPEGGYTYEQYVNDFLEICNPQVLSYDSYPFHTTYTSKEYLTNLAFIRDRAIANEIPFWFFVQAYGAGGTKVPDETDMLWQVNTALSYGTKGLQYFCFFKADGENFEGCLVDFDGSTTNLYDYAKRCNEQVQAVDEVLMCSLSKGVIFTGSSIVDKPTLGTIEEYGNLLEVEGRHALTGCFDYDGKDTYYITNNSLKENDEITLTFDTNVKGYYILDSVKYSFNSNKLEISLTPGNGVLVVTE